MNTKSIPQEKKAEQVFVEAASPEQDEIEGVHENNTTTVAEPTDVNKEIKSCEKNAVSESTLEFGTINLRLHIPELFDLLIPIPLEPQTSWTTLKTTCYNTVCRKYWQRTSNKTFQCLICMRAFGRRDAIITHLNHHMRYKMVRCTICSRGFCSFNWAKKHAKKCTVESSQGIA